MWQTWMICLVAVHTVLISIPGMDMSATGDAIEYDIDNMNITIAGYNLSSLYIITDAFEAAGRNVDFQYWPNGVHAEIHNGSLEWVRWNESGICVGGMCHGNFSIRQVMN